MTHRASAVLRNNVCSSNKQTQLPS